MKTARVAAMDYLARREHSRAELTHKLSAKGYGAEQVMQALAQLSAEGLQSDRRFGDNYARARMRAGFGPKRIVMELQQKGVEADLIAACVYADEIDWWENLQAVWQKKFASTPENAKDYARQQRFLMQRGFDSQQIHTLLKAPENVCDET